jgi:hypothetical protein
MGFRLRRSIKLAPGIRWNIGAKSTSVSLGPRGAKFTVGTRGTRTTVGLPGTGLSYTVVSPRRGTARAASTQPTSIATTAASVQKIDPTRFGISRFPYKLVTAAISLVLLFTSATAAGFVGLLIAIAIPSRQAAARRELKKRMASFRDAIKEGGSGTAAVDGLEKIRDELSLLRSDIPLESELLDGMRAVCAWQEAGSILANIPGHDRIIGAETCHFVGHDVLLDKRGPDERGRLFITPTRLIFLGEGLTEIPLRKIAICDFDPSVRALKVQRSDRQTAVRFCFAKFTDVMMADAVIKTLNATMPA